MFESPNWGGIGKSKSPLAAGLWNLVNWVEFQLHQILVC